MGPSIVSNGYVNERTEALETEGYRVLRFTNAEVEGDIERVVAKIARACEETP